MVMVIIMAYNWANWFIEPTWVKPCGPVCFKTHSSVFHSLRCSYVGVTLKLDYGAMDHRLSVVTVQDGLVQTQ